MFLGLLAGWNVDGKPVEGRNSSLSGLTIGPDPSQELATKVRASLPGADVIIPETLKLYKVKVI